MEENNPRRELYNMLKEDGYYNGNYSAFTANIDKPNARRELFDMLTADGYYNGDWDSFNKRLTKTVYNPTTNRAVQVEKPQNTWEQTVNNYSAGVKGAPMMLTPFGQNEWSKSSLQPDRIQKEALTPKKSKADRIIEFINEQHNQTQPSPYKPLGTTYEMAKESMPEQKQMDEMFEQTMSDANKRFADVYEKEMRTASSYSTNAMLGTHLAASRRANEEVTPSKIIGAIQEKIMGAPQNSNGGNGNAPVDPIMQ